MIKLEQVTKRYGTQIALDNLSLHIHEGECIVLIGPSGCGKSTLLRSLNRLVGLDQGTIEILGRNLNDWHIEELRRSMGYCIQNVGLFPHLTVKDNIALLLSVMGHSKDHIEARVDELLDLTQLPLSYKDKKPHQLSGGEAQRVGVCRALAADPPILLMDEPFGALDPLTRTSVQMAFRDIQQRLRKTVVFVTHDLEEAILLGDRIALMHQGKLIHVETPERLNQAPQVFTQSFIGKEYLVYLLQRYTLADVQCPLSQTDTPSIDLTLDSTVQEALALILAHPAQKVHFVDHGTAYALSYEVIQRFIQTIIYD